MVGAFYFAAMSLYYFNLLSPEVQLRYTLNRGTYLASRWEEKSGVNLYHVPGERGGFFVELGIEQGQLVVMRSFTSSVPLEDYTHGVQLPEL